MMGRTKLKLSTEVKQMTIKITEPGLFTTVQDLGRRGYESYGFSPAGAMDYRSYCLANALVGNGFTKATLEMTFQGAQFTVLKKTTIATAGAPMKLTVNNQPYRIGTIIDLDKGDQVVFGSVESGVRTYVAFTGGLDLPSELGSYATHTRSGIGGYKGRVLRAGDILKTIGGHADVPLLEVDEVIETHEVEEIRVILGQESERFNAEYQNLFKSSEYTVSKDTDRMGARLEGPAIKSDDGHDILSAPTQYGSIQIPKNGQPIILLADRQTAGGYTKIATVAKVDLPKIAQKQPGDRIRFKEISVESASALYKESLEQLQNKIDLVPSKDFEAVRRTDANSVSKLIGG